MLGDDSCGHGISNTERRRANHELHRSTGGAVSGHRKVVCPCSVNSAVLRPKNRGELTRSSTEMMTVSTAMALSNGRSTATYRSGCSSCRFTTKRSRVGRSRSQVAAKRNGARSRQHESLRSDRWRVTMPMVETIGDGDDVPSFGGVRHRQSIRPSASVGARRPC